MRRATIALLLACLTTSITGCGGCSSGTTEDEMRKRVAGLKRRKDSDDPPAAVAATPSAAAQPTANLATPLPIALAANAPAVPPTTPPTSAPAAKPIENAKPDQPLTPEERLVRAVANLEKIGAALLAFEADKNRGLLPRAATIADDGKTPLLSWRVQILPHLGYEALYKQFRLNEPWDSLHNKKLLAQIPPEYQSPERFDTTTNFLVPVGSNTSFSVMMGQAPRFFEGKRENVVLLVEADDSLAVPWTKPQDLTYQHTTPKAGLGGLRTNGFLAVLCDGLVCRVPADAPNASLHGIFSIDGGPAPAGAFVKEPIPEPAAAIVSNPPPSSPAAGDDSSTSRVAADAPAPATAMAPALDIASLNPLTAQAIKDPAPSAAALQRSRELLKDVYRQEYEQARNPQVRLALAKKMLADSVDVSANAADYYELLRIVRDLSLSAGALEQALTAVDKLDERFQIDGMAMRLKTLEDFSKAPQGRQSAQVVAKAAGMLAQKAVEADNFPAALQACDLYLAVVQGDRLLAAQATQTREAVKNMSDAYADVPAALISLQADPADAKASETVGTYYCLVKNRWDTGLPLLAQGDDIKLRGVALIDLDVKKPPQSMLQLADHYLEMANDYKPPLDRGLRLRAAHYYAQAALHIPGSLERIKAQKRLDELREHFGRQWLDQTLGLTPVKTAAVADDN